MIYQKSAEEMMNYLKTIAGYRAETSELITILFPKNKKKTEIIELIQDEINESKNIKLKKTQKNVISALESLLQKLKISEINEFSKGVIAFSGKNIFYQKEYVDLAVLIEPTNFVITKKLYWCDSKFRLKELIKIIESTASYFFLLLDRRDACYGSLSNNTFHIQNRLESFVRGKHRHGGQSAQRFERLIELEVHAFLTKIGDEFRKYLEQQTIIDGILIGGPAYTKNEFVDKKYISYPFDKKIIGIYSIDYIDENGINNLLKQSENELDLKFIKVRKQIDNFLKYSDEKQKEFSGLNLFNHLHKIKTILIHSNCKIREDCYFCSNCGKKLKKISFTLDNIECCNKKMVLEKSKIIYDSLKEIESINLITIESNTDEAKKINLFDGIIGLDS